MVWFSYPQLFSFSFYKCEFSRLNYQRQCGGTGEIYVPSQLPDPSELCAFPLPKLSVAMSLKAPLGQGNIVHAN